MTRVIRIAGPLIFSLLWACWSVGAALAQVQPDLGAQVEIPAIETEKPEAILGLAAAQMDRRDAAVALDDSQVLRYTPLRRLVHALLLFSFLALALTALMFWFGRVNAGGSAGRLHMWAGLVFGAALLATMILFMQDMRFISDDRRWLARWGGYFGDSGELPAGKFNAGQKVFFWCLVFSGLGQLLTGLIMYLAHGLSGTWSQIVYTVHDTLGVLLILLVLGHVYLAVIINPGPCGPFSEAGPRVRPKSALAVPNLLRRLTWRHREDFANF